MSRMAYVLFLIMALNTAPNRPLPSKFCLLNISVPRSMSLNKKRGIESGAIELSVKRGELFPKLLIGAESSEFSVPTLFCSPPISIISTCVSGFFITLDEVVWFSFQNDTYAYSSATC